MEERLEQTFIDKQKSQLTAAIQEKEKDGLHEKRQLPQSIGDQSQIKCRKEAMDNKKRQSSIKLSTQCLKEESKQNISESQALIKAYLFITSLHSNSEKVESLLQTFQTLEKASENTIINIQHHKLVAKSFKTFKTSKLSYIGDKKDNPSKIKQNNKISIKLIHTKSNLISIRCFNETLNAVSINELKNKDLLTNQPKKLKTRVQNFGSVILRQTQNKMPCQTSKLSLKKSQSDKDTENLLKEIQEIKQVDFSQSLLKSSESSELFSGGIQNSIKDIKLPNITVTQDLINAIFESCQICLINLSFCIMMKFAIKNREYLLDENICWLLSVSTIISFKIYYDEQIQDLIEHYSSILMLQQIDVAFLEKWVLQKIDYKVGINGRFYEEMMNLLVQVKKI